jgi:hypothetical protein
MDDKYLCSICGEAHDEDEMHELTIKGKPKKICKQCATAVKGLV